MKQSFQSKPRSQSRRAGDDAGEEDTRTRLIDAAGGVFAEHGFRSATVRDICAAADANIASVNYYFRDKAGLYAAVLQAAHAQAEQEYPYLAGGSGLGEVGARERLGGFIKVMLQRMLDPGKPAWHGRLMAREMSEPTEALDQLVKLSIRPKRDMLVEIVREMLSEAASIEIVEACARSVIGQLIFYKNNRAVIERLFPDVRYDAPGIAKIAEHVTLFSLAAIDRLREQKAGGGGA